MYEYFTNDELFYNLFWKLHSTEQASLEMVDRTLQYLDHGKLPIKVCLNESKTFDTINHEIILKVRAHLLFLMPSENIHNIRLPLVDLMAFENYKYNWERTTYRPYYLQTIVLFEYVTAFLYARFLRCL